MHDLYGISFSSRISTVSLHWEGSLNLFPMSKGCEAQKLQFLGWAKFCITLRSVQAILQFRSLCLYEQKHASHFHSIIQVLFCTCNQWSISHDGNYLKIFSRRSSQRNSTSSCDRQSQFSPFASYHIFIFSSMFLIKWIVRRVFNAAGNMYCMKMTW